MERIVALVDYDNQRLGIFRSGRTSGSRANYRDHEDYLRALIAGLLDYRNNHCLSLSPSLVELYIRLYGGWLLADGAFSDMAEIASKAIRSIGRSQRIGNTRVFLELVQAPLCEAEDVLWWTYRTTPWLGARFTLIGLPPQCIHSGSCPNIDGLLSWAGGRCPERSKCNARVRDVFLIETQKLVDTMIASDAIFAKLQGADDIVTVSMDDDIVPAVLTVASLRGSISVLRFGKVNPGPYDGLLLRRSVRVIDRPALG